MLPVSGLFSGEPLHYKTAFCHYRKWYKAGARWGCWIRQLSNNRSKIDLSGGDFDGSHTTPLEEANRWSTWGRKKRKTANDLYLTDRQGLPLAMWARGRKPQRPVRYRSARQRGLYHHGGCGGFRVRFRGVPGGMCRKGRCAKHTL